MIVATGVEFGSGTSVQLHGPTTTTRLNWSPKPLIRAAAGTVVSVRSMPFTPPPGSEGGRRAVADLGAASEPEASGKGVLRQRCSPRIWLPTHACRRAVMAPARCLPANRVAIPDRAIRKHSGDR